MKTEVLSSTTQCLIIFTPRLISEQPILTMKALTFQEKPSPTVEELTPKMGVMSEVSIWFGYSSV